MRVQTQMNWKRNMKSINESDNLECKHCDFKELESGNYCKNGNELDGFFAILVRKNLFQH